MLIGVILLLLLGVAWTIEGCMYSITAEKKLNFTYVFLGCAILNVVVGCALLPFQPMPDFHDRTVLILLGVIFSAGLATYTSAFLLTKSMESGPNGILWAIYQAAMLFPFSIGILVHGDAATVTRLVGIGALTIGILLLGVGGDLKKQAKAKASSGSRWRWLLPGVASFFVNGLAQYLMTISSRYPEALDQLTNINRTTVLNLGIIAAGLVYSFAHGELTKRSSRHDVVMALWMAILMAVIALVGYYFLLFPGSDRLTAAGAGAIVYPLPVGTCIIVFTIYSLIHLREKYTIPEWLGLLLSTAGVVVISL
ncbi:MAG: EamA family transporter [Lentisphaeria bacterium]|nr:EamA family transporter [Lentisphaeria bacterium]